MQCFSPLYIKNPSKASLKLRLTVPCGKCMACLSNRRADWSNRLEKELKYAKSAHFITITYNDENIPEHGTLEKIEVQNWIKRLRSKLKHKIKYYLVGEYGEETLRPHYHAIIFNLNSNQEKAHTLLEDTWGKGYIHMGTVTPQSISYCTKYMIQSEHVYEGVQKPFALMSKRPPIGAEYINKMSEWHNADETRFYIQKEDGEKTRLPRYFREKIYSRDARIRYNNSLELLDSQTDPKMDFEKINPNGHYFSYIEDQKRLLSASIKKTLKNQTL